MEPAQAAAGVAATDGDLVLHRPLADPDLDPCPDRVVVRGVLVEGEPSQCPIGASRALGHARRGDAVVAPQPDVLAPDDDHDVEQAVAR